MYTEQFVWLFHFALIFLPAADSFIFNSPRTVLSFARHSAPDTMYTSALSEESPAERLTHKLRSQGISFALVPSDNQLGAGDCKTLIWEAITSTTADGEESFYFATALRTRDRVDEALLIQALKRSDVVGLRIAATDVAESLTGFVSGTIPPFGHCVPLALYMDQQLLDLDVLSLGSGSVGYDLQIERTQMIQFSQATAQVFVQPIVNGAPTPVADAPVKIEKTHSNVVDTSRKPELPELKLKEKPLPDSWKLKPLAKRLRDVAGKESLYDQVEACLEEAGDDLMILMYGGKYGNYTKTPVHNAAWRASIEVLDLFIEAGKRIDEDLINIKAIGEGNYGKTPIFYAITRSRDDMVDHCLDLGADLLIVNNKGQSPCSLAQSHVSKEICEKMYRIEEEQLRSGRSFQNFRFSNSDSHKYGDLDPRFPIDDINLGDDINDAVEEYERGKNKLPKVNGVPVGPGFVRSMRPTTGEIRNVMACERWGKTPKMKYLIGDAKKPSKPKKQAQKKKVVEMIDVSDFDVLETKDVLDAPGDITVVDSLESIDKLSSAIDETIDGIRKAAELSPTMTDMGLALHSWGLDSEWRPKTLSINNDCPISVLQLSSKKCAFVLDLLNLCQQSSCQDDLPMTATEHFLSDTLSKLFNSVDIAVVGFGVIQDLSKLSFSYPHIPCFRQFESVIDFQSFSRSALGKHFKTEQINSLQKLVATILRKRLDKSEQCSDWEERPMRASQVEYAALDAAVCRHLLVETFRLKDFNFQFFQRHAHLRQTVRMTFLLPEQEQDRSIRHHVEMGNERTFLGVRLAKQAWPTSKEAPLLPTLMTEEEMNRPVQRKERNKKKSNKERRSKSVLLKTLGGNLETLPPAGIYMGYTKDSCVEAILGKTIVNSIASDFFLRFNRRGGIVELANCWCLFINFSGHDKNWKYSNQFSDDGREINFSVNALHGYKENDLPFLYDVGCFDESLEYVPTSNKGREIFLFARSGSDSKFIACGQCKCLGWTGGEGKYELQLQLTQYDDLKAEPESPYLRMVENEEMKEAESTLSWAVIA